jgi:predicted dehydrogenase
MKILIVGSGYMAKEYLRVLDYFKCNVIIVGRNTDKVNILKEEFPRFLFNSGGISQYVADGKEIPDFAINAASVDQLKETSIELIKAGVKYLLIEKPGALFLNDLKEIFEYSQKHNVESWIAYNRRFYSSLIALKEEVRLDGGIISAHFEFTEWLHTIDTQMYSRKALSKWIIANSSHVIDTAFNIIGLPAKISTIVHGQNVIEWHPSGSLFIGSGISVNGIPFTYHSNWESAGRWSIEILTNERRFFLKPMERLLVQLKGSTQVNEFAFYDQNDILFKPGLLLQVKAFLDLERDKLVSINEQIYMMPFYDKIGGY